MGRRTSTKVATILLPVWIHFGYCRSTESQPLLRNLQFGREQLHFSKSISYVWPTYLSTEEEKSDFSRALLNTFLSKLFASDSHLYISREKLWSINLRLYHTSSSFYYCNRVIVPYSSMYLNWNPTTKQNNSILSVFFEEQPELQL